MTEPEIGLHTLTYRIEPAQLGELVLYPLGPAFAASWDRFVKTIKRRSSPHMVLPRYSDLAAALTAMTGQPVRLFPSKNLSARQKEREIMALLVTTATIDPWLITTAVRTFERLSANDSTVDTLAPCLDYAVPVVQPLSAYVDHQDGVIVAPGWIYDIAGWNLATRLCQQPLMIDGQLPVTLRMDTEGNLVAWDQPISSVSNSKAGHATIHIDAEVVTIPGAAHLYLRLDAHVGRSPSNWWGVKHVWVARTGDVSMPLLRLPILAPWPKGGRDHPEYANHVAAIAQQCQLDPLPSLPDQPPSEPGPVRLIGKPARHPVGVGPGARLTFQLQQHATQILGLCDLRYGRTKITTPHGGTGQIPVTTIDDSVVASGTRHLRIACLYDAQLTRKRAVDALSTYSAGAPDVLWGVLDDEPMALTDRLSVVFHRAADALAHGEHDRDLDSLECLRGDDDMAVVVLAETRWEPGTTIEHDAKPALRADLGRRGIVAQFVNGNYEPKRPRRRPDGTTPIPEDYQMVVAVRDLLRQAGVVDNRLAVATTRPGLTSPLTKPATLVGVHIRLHTPRRKKGVRQPNQLVIQLVAVHATPEDKPWTIEMYDDTEGWIGYRLANAHYYAGDVGKAGLNRSWNNTPLVRDYVDQALAALPRNKALVVFVEAAGSRGFWQGLNHNQFGRGALPGSTINHPDIAVVRCASGAGVSRPTHQNHTPRVSDPYKPDLPRGELYEHQEGAVANWMLAQPSRVHRASAAGRAGTDYTRWTLPPNRDRLMSGNWHALTAIEIAVAQSGSWEPSELAALTARLCNQAASWDDRTRLPTPLHLAKSADDDHPGQPAPDEQDTELAEGHTQHKP